MVPFALHKNFIVCFSPAIRHLPSKQHDLWDRICWLFRHHIANIGPAVAGSARPVPPPMVERIVMNVCGIIINKQKKGSHHHTESTQEILNDIMKGVLVGLPVFHWTADCKLCRTQKYYLKLAHWYSWATSNQGLDYPGLQGFKTEMVFWHDAEAYVYGKLIDLPDIASLPGVSKRSTAGSAEVQAIQSWPEHVRLWLHGIQFLVFKQLWGHTLFMRASSTCISSIEYREQLKMYSSTTDFCSPT